MDSSFMVSPMNQQIKLAAGQTYSGSISVTNPADSKSDFAYRISVAPYSVVGEEYDLDLETLSNYSSIVNWIKIDEPNGVIASNETREVHFTIEVPESAASGGQYATIIVGQDSENPQNEGLAIQNIYEIASIIYADVEGQTIHDGNILENHIPGFTFDLPIVTSALLNNNGNVHETARISVTVKNKLNGEILFPKQNESNTIEEVIMPETTRHTVRNVNTVAPLGIYEINQTVAYMGNVSEISQTVIVCPIWFFILIILTVSATIFGIIRLIIKKHRRRHVF